MLLYLHRPSSYPPVAELGREELKLGGLRLDPVQNSRSRMGYNLALEFAPLPPGGPPGAPRRVTGIPPGAWLNFVSWSPSGCRVAFALRGSGEPGAPPRGALTLWVADVDTCQARRQQRCKQLHAGCLPDCVVQQARPVLPGFQLNTVRRSGMLSL